MAYHLSLEETASPDDLRFDASGIPFVAEARFQSFLSGLRIETQTYMGREGLFAYHPGFRGSC